MADAYPFPLLVEFEENKVPRLKNKLVKYFQSKKSHGGDCTVEHDSGSRTAVLRFRTEQDQRNVLEKGSHQLPLDNNNLKLRVRLMSEKQEFPADKDRTKPTHVPAPSTEATAELLGKAPSEASPSSVSLQGSAPSKDPLPTASVLGSTPSEDPLPTASVLGSTPSEDPLPTASVLGNVPSDLTQEFLEMLVENIMKKPEGAASEGITVEMIPAKRSAVVCFKTGQENNDFVSHCPQNRTFKSKKLTVEALDPTSQVLIEDSDRNEDILRMYFENQGADVKEVEINLQQQNTLITFTNCRDVHRLLQKPHQLRKTELKLYPYYKCLGRALYGSDRPPLKLPAAVSETPDQAVFRFLSSRPSALQPLQDQLRTHWCQADLVQGSVTLSPEPELLQQQEQVIREWTGTVRPILSQFLSQFKPCKLKPPPDLWRQSLEKISAFLTNKDQVVMVPDESSGIIKVVGLESDLSKLHAPLCESINSLIKRARREQSQVTEQLKVRSSVFKLLSQDGLQQKLLSVYPELKFDTHGPFPKITGLTDEIAATNKCIYDEMFAMKRQNLEIDRAVLEFLQGEDQEQLTNALLGGKNAVFEIHANRIQLLACSDQDLNDAETYLKSLLAAKYIPAEDRSVLRTNGWQQLVDSIEKEDNKGRRKVQIRTEADQVVVSGFKDSVARVSHELDDYLNQNANIQESVAVNPVIKLEYLQTFAPKSKLDALKANVTLSFMRDGINLSGSRVNVEQCVGLAEDLVESIAFDSLTVTKHGARKLFEDKDTAYLSVIGSKDNCLVKIVDAADAKQSLLPKPVYEIQTPDGVKIFVSNADMCSYQVQAVVNATVEDLQLSGGLSAALLKAAGPQLQVECHKIIQTRGNLKPGECEVTNAGGSLYCKKIIHAVAPHYDNQQAPKVISQLKRAVKRSLELAEQHQCDSLALPVISRNRKFPLNLCAQTIVKAIKEYCEDRYDESFLTSIHLVNNDAAVVQALVDAVKKEFGDRGKSHAPNMAAASVPQPVILPTPSTSAQAQAAAVDPNCVGQVQTKEGVELCVLKGNLEKATTDIIVNTVTEDLVLTRGAVSNAVFSAAGPTLQTLVTAKQPKASVGQVIVTEGCNLRCQQVYHAVPPHYDNGQGTAQKQLSGVFKECLSRAEDTGMTSISFSAIGAGNLGFPKDLVASLVLERVLDFSSKKPKNLKKIQVILFPGDPQTIQAFSAEFQKNFPKPGGSSPTAPSGGPFSKIVSTSSMHETKLGAVAVQVVTGDITKETTDVIVNSSNEKFSLKSGVSKAILEAAGPAVENECQTLGSQPNDGIILTQPGNLKCKKILHLVGKTDLTKITKVVKEALQTCIKNSLTSVAFPAIGTGQGNVGAKSVADAMLDAVIEVLTKNPSSCLKTVKIVIFQNQMLKDFHDSLQQRAASDSKDKEKAKEGSMLGSWATKLKSFFVSPAPEKTQKNGDFVIKALKPAPVCFHICGEFPYNVSATKQKINSLLSKELQSTSIKDETILSLSSEDHKRIVEIQKKMEVGICIESKNGEGTISIEGLAKDLLVVSNQIHEMLKTTRLEEDLNQKAELLSAVVEWQYMQQGQDFKSFDPKTSYELEQARDKKQKELKVKVNGQEFTVKMPNGPATAKNGSSLQIQRINKMSDLPEFWDQMDTSSCKIFPVSPGTPEYTKVEQQFKASCNRNIIKIDRVQNLVLWQSLQIKKRAMDQKNGHSNNERHLFHGTSDDTVAFINEHGFNRSYAGKNATAFGKGTYFAVNAQYSSSDTYSQPDANGQKYMYLCAVLTGDFTTGSSNMIEPPLKKAGSIEKYDSVVDNTLKPTMFIIFHDSHAYPEYLITFK